MIGDMFNKFTFNHNKDVKTFFVSDTHFCHDRDFILGKRGFSNISEHDIAIKNRWNDIVSPQDNVIHLGDFLVGAGNDAFKRGQEILFSLNGHIHFLWGNHNSYVKEIYRISLKEKIGECDLTTEMYPITYQDKITFYGNNLLAKIKTEKNSQYIFCSHFAHRIWIDSHKGSVWHLSGHSHGVDVESQPEYLNSSRLDVGIENFGGPVSFDDIKVIMDKKMDKKIDHH